MIKNKIVTFISSLVLALGIATAATSALAVTSTTPYSNDANTVLLDHFDGATGASILAYSETGAACGSAKPSATPNSAYVTGPGGLSQALSLNPPAGQPAGSATYLQYPGGQLLSQANGTIEFWTYLSSYGTGGVSLVDQGPYYGSCAGWTFGMGVNATGQLNAGAWAAFTMNSGANIVPLNTWTHVAASWGSSGAKLYINGVQVGSDVNTGMPASGYGGSVLIRAGTHTGAGSQIDELRISNVQRTSFSTSGGAGTGAHTASGTYTWNSTTGVATWNWTASDFVGCDGPSLGTKTNTGVVITATTMTWPADNMTWTRASGTAGDIVGTWTFTDSTTGNSYTATVNADGTVSVAAVIVSISSCGGGSTWAAKAPMPAARYGAATGSVNGVLYVAGGADVAGPDSALRAYNPATDSWSVLAPMPGGRYSGDGAAVINGQLYVAGGWTWSPPLPNSNLWAYNPVSNAWSTLASMPILSACGSSGAINGKLYVTTGCDGNSGWRNFLHVYDPATNAWSALASSPDAHASGMGAAINGKFYVVGGVGSTSVTGARLDVYDPATNAWSTLAPMPTARQNAVTAVLNGKLYVIGGYSAASTYLPTVEVYDPVTNTWTTETPMITPRQGAAADVVNGVIYVVGGSDATGALAVNEALSFTGGTGTGTHTASGTYTWNLTTGDATFNWTSSDFVCGGPKLGTQTKTGVTITATTMIWPNDQMTWTRSSGAVGDIVGTWTATDSTTGNSFTATVNANGTVSVVGNMVLCGNIFYGTGSDQAGNHWLNIGIDDPLGTIQSAVLTYAGTASVTGLGTGILNSAVGSSAGPATGKNWRGFFDATNTSAGTFNYNAFPTLPITYTLTITDTSGAVSTRQVTYSGLNTNFVSNISPSGNYTGTTAPTFTWAVPPNASNVRDYVVELVGISTPFYWYWNSLDFGGMPNASSPSALYTGAMPLPACSKVIVGAEDMNGNGSLVISYLGYNLSAGQTCGPNGVVATSDTTAPTVPTGVNATPTSSTQVSLSWAASTDNVGVTGYQVYRNGVLVGSPAGTSYSDTGLIASTAYSYTVAACDAAANCSAQSTPAASATTPAGTGVSQFDGVYSGTWSLTCPSCGSPNASGTFTTTLVNGVFTNIMLPITSGNFGMLIDSGTVSSSGVITGSGAAPSQCSGSASSVTGQITTALGVTTMNMTYSRSMSGTCGAETGTITATLAFPIANTSRLESSMGAAFDGTNFLVGIADKPTPDPNNTNQSITAQFVSKTGALVGSRISTGAIGGGSMVAFDGTNYLLVYEEITTNTVAGQFVNTSGALVGSPFNIVNTATDRRLGYLRGLLFDGTNYFVVWKSNSTAGNGDTADVFGQFITPSGAKLGSVVSISTAVHGQKAPAIAFDGANILAVWADGRNQSACYTDGTGTHCFESDVYGQFITKSGASAAGSLSGSNFLISAGTLPRDGSPLGIAFDGTNYLITFTEELTFPNACSISGCNWEAYGTLVSKTGTPVGSRFVIGNAATRPKFIPLPTYLGTQYLVTWTDGFGTTSASVKGQYVTTSGAVSGQEFTLFSPAPSGAVPWLGMVFTGGGVNLVTTNWGIPDATAPGNMDIYTSADVTGSIITGSGADTQAPTVPTGLVATPASSSQVNLSWTASTDNVGVTGYKVYRNGTLVGSPTATSYSDTGLTAATGYSYTVAACDAAGNCSASSAVASAAASFSIASGWAGVVAASGGTNFLVALESDTTTAKVAAQLMSLAGAKIGSPVALGHDGQSCCASGAAFDGTNYLVTWEEDQGIKNSPAPFLVYGQFMNTSGAAVGSAFAMTTAGIWFDGINMLAYGGGKYLLTYTRLIVPAVGDTSPTNRYVAGRIVSPDGTMGNEFRISGGYGNGSSVTFDGTNFFVVWKEDSLDYEVRGRFVSPSGTLGQEISINASPALSDYPVRAAFDGTNYMVVWTDSVGSEGDVFGQRVSPNGVLVGGPITIVSDPGMQMAMSVAFDGANHVVVWTDMNNNANWDVYGQYVGKDGALVGSKFAINTDAGNQFGGVGCAGGKCMALVSSGIVMGQGGPTQVGEVYGAFLTSTPALPDTQAPTIPAGLSATPASSSQVNLSWTASTDNVGVTGYKVYRNGTLVSSPAGTSYSDTGLTASTLYSYTVAACDAAANCSVQSGAVSATTLAIADTQAPTVPAGLSATPASSSQVNLSWTASTDNVGVTGYKVYRNSVLVGSPAGTSYSDSGLTAATGYSYTVAACDAANNCSVQSSAVSATTNAGAVTLNFTASWNLVGNSVNAPLDVVAAFGDTTKVQTVWKWIPATSKWAFYAPSMTAPNLTSYAASKGYDVLTAINGGEGFWVNAKVAFTAQLPAGTAISSLTFADQTPPPNNLPFGWSLIAIGDNKTPRSFVTAISTTTPVTGTVPTSIITLWAWDSSSSGWYFYAPSLVNNGGLTNYITSKGYLDFGTKTLDPTTGFWVNHP